MTREPRSMLKDSPFRNPTFSQYSKAATSTAPILPCVYACDKDRASVGVYASWLCVRASDCGIWTAAFLERRGRGVRRRGDVSARVRLLHDDANANVVRRIETPERQRSAVLQLVELEK